VSSPSVDSSPAHLLPVRVGWGHCDPAGIVYFPRFFEMFHAAMESWFSDALGLPYQDVIMGRKVGFPAVHTEADFRRPSVFGEDIVVEQRVERLGRTSIEFAYRVIDAAGQLRLSGRTVCAVMDLDPDHATFRRAVELPEDMRARIEAFLAG
jgi:4-hydroxybenzoyl-CoA thioesterase